ncbi:DNA helicase RecG, partial [filamentous cyanobacterium CCP5]
MAEGAVRREVSPDWGRLQRSLTVEAERGFNNLVGREHRFSDFLSQQLRQPPATLSAEDQQIWHQLADQFSQYSDLAFSARQHLVADTRRTLHQTQRQLETIQRRQSTSTTGKPGSQAASPKAREKIPKVTPLSTVPEGSRQPQLDWPVTYLKGIGPKNSDRLAKLGLLTVKDLLFYYPRDHINYARQVAIAQLEPGETVTVVATVKRCNCFSSPRNPKLTIFELHLRDHSGSLKLNRFYPGARYSNPSWQQRQKRQFPTGATVAASGLVKKGKYGITLEDPDLEVIDSRGEIDSLKVGRVVPVYPLTEGVHADLVRKAVVAALPAVATLPEPLPVDIRQRYGLIGAGEAIASIHFPETDEALQAARRRLVFDEFFYLQLGLLRRRQQQRQQQTSVVLAPTGELIESFYSVIPFAFTGAQQRVTNDILNDLQQNVPMNRLVQGDVGSGKTVVAVVAILAAIQAGYQAALMAPTEVLAEQHYRKLVEWFTQLHLTVDLLTGSTRAAKRRGIHGELATGELPVLVGTHALIEDPVQFQNLGLVVIDEQHRFGVQQRARLQQKGDNPHVLTLTATPIPRTLALTLHGNLDVSQIDELPPGRKAI